MENTPLPTLLWRHPRPEETRTFQFKQYLESKYSLQLTDYKHLYQWSIENLGAFWESVWDFTGIHCSKRFEKVLDPQAALWPRPTFFEGARLNFAQNLLFPSADPQEDSPAIVEVTELSRQQLSWRELRTAVLRCSNALRRHGISRGDRVAAYLSNTSYAVISMLSAASIGAVWSAISPDQGVHAVLDRLQQIEPAILFADTSATYNGKTHDLTAKIRDIVAGLPTVLCVLSASKPSTKLDAQKVLQISSAVYWYDDFLCDVDCEERFEFEQLPAEHPVYILYSSGTTGKPKGIVHGSIGTLIQHKKEHDIQCSMLPGDRLLYYTTCSWMMWHWQVSALATGVTVVLYDGSPFRYVDSESNDDLAMPKIIDELQITHFGTSAKYLSLLEQRGARPNEHCKLSSLKAIYSTGSPLAPSTFSYVERHFANVNIASITGGTDIISLFGAPSQICPVYAGEIQCRGLGMAVAIWDQRGHDVTNTSQAGELVCLKPFPCQPVSFWGAEGDQKYKASYFERFPGVWHHGDWASINASTGGLIMLGRSDGVLKPAGIRFGSSEIYNVLLQNFVETEDALCVGRRKNAHDDESVVLFLKMRPDFTLSDELRQRIRAEIRKDLSARHVPEFIDETPEIPVTANGKKVETAVKHILCGGASTSAASIANADCLEWYKEWDKQHST